METDRWQLRCRRMFRFLECRVSLGMLDVGCWMLDEKKKMMTWERARAPTLESYRHQPGAQSGGA